MHRILLIFAFVILSPVILRAQCEISGKRNACVNDLVTFGISGSGGIAAYSWNFGTYGNSSSANPVVKFTSQGSITISCTITLSAGGTCTDTHTLLIRPRPTAGLSVESGSDYCFSTNKICLRNTSTPASIGLNNLSLLWGDGNIKTSTQPIPGYFCHSYLDTGNFKINLEIADSFGCKDVFSITVRIKPSVSIKPGTQITNFCDSVRICFSDNASGKGPFTRKWYDNSNGNLLGTANPLCRTVKPGDLLELKVTTTNSEGCSATDVITAEAPLNKLVIGGAGICYCMNEIESGQVTLNANASVSWTMNGSNLGKASFMKITSAKFGWNKITVTQTTPCPLTYTDSICVRGVVAKGRHFNQNRRLVQDTAIFMDLTAREPGSRLMKLWNFNDIHAPFCTTWTKYGENIRSNCLFSRDSLAQHYYKRAGCYSARLFVYDTATGCFDDTVFMVFRDDSCEKIFSKATVCLGDGVDFKLTRASWFKIGRNNILYTDTGRIRDSMILTNIPKRYVYKTPGLKSPVLWRYYGPDTNWLLKNGKVVYDTIRPGKGWQADTFKNAINVVAKPVTKFTTTVISPCAPYLVRIRFTDSLFIKPKTMNIDWGDTIINYPVSGEVYKLLPIDHVYRDGGMYIIRVTLTNSSDCSETSRDTVKLGWNIDFGTNDNCSGGLICFYDSVTTFGSRNKWTAAKNEGRLYWNWGDNSGPDSGFSRCHYYNWGGIFKVRLTIVGNNGCKQSVTREFKFTRAVARIRFQPVIYCSEIRQYFDSSFIAGPDGMDKIVSWSWDFGDGSKPKTVQHPAHIFPSGGVYQVKLVIKTQNGCMDSFIRSMVVLGPQVRAVIGTDSIGCNPLRVTFVNQSKQTGTFIWEFGDPGKNFLSTDKDTSVSFTYRKPGTYFAYLTGGDSFYNPTTGSRYYCSVKYPSPGQKQLRITVLPTANITFTGPDTLCLSDSAIFNNTTKDTGVDFFRWTLDTAVRKAGYESIGYKFPKTGTYSVKLKPDFNGVNACADSAVKQITVVVLQPSFDWDCHDAMTPILRLKNTSNLSADNYKWTQLDPVDSSETLLQTGRDLNYMIGTDTGRRIICLSLNTGDYCAVRYCRSVHLQRGVTLANVFTPGADGLNDTYRVPLIGYEDFSMKIFNRWGERIFYSTNPAVEWNGRVQNTGTELPEGTYFYIVQFRDPCSGELKEVNGSVNLIR